MSSRAASTVSSPAAKAAGRSPRVVRIMTLEERVADMRAHRKEVGCSRESVLAFLKRAKILTASGKLAKPFRAT